MYYILIKDGFGDYPERTIKQVCDNMDDCFEYIETYIGIYETKDYRLILTDNKTVSEGYVLEPPFFMAGLEKFSFQLQTHYPELYEKFLLKANDWSERVLKELEELEEAKKKKRRAEIRKREYEQYLKLKELFEQE